MSADLPDFAGLRDPAAIAEARRALDAAAQRAEADAKAAKQHATAEAARQRVEALEAEVAALVGSMEPVTAAREALAEAQRRHADAEVELKRAEWVVESARAAVPRLVKRKLAGENITRDDVLAAHNETGQAEHFATFQSIVASRLAAAVPEAEAAVKVAIAEAHRPVADRGIRLRIEAGIAVDASMQPSGYRDVAQVEAARKLFDHGNALLTYAANRGFKLEPLDGLSLNFPTRERSERNRWKRHLQGNAP